MTIGEGGRDIPGPIQRAVRIKCGFGCVICGKLLTEYHHIVPYAECRSHDVDNIVLLCRGHHAEYHSGRLLIDRIISASANPFAKRRGFNYGAYTFEPMALTRVVIGGNVFVCKNARLNVITFDKFPAFSIDFDEGVPEFSFHLFDHTDRLRVSVERNVFSMDSGLWDVDLRGKYLRIGLANLTQLLKLRLEKSVLTFERMTLYYKGHIVEIHSDGIRLHNSKGQIIMSILASRYDMPDHEFTFLKFGDGGPSAFAMNWAAERISETAFYKILRSRPPKLPDGNFGGRVGAYGRYRL